MSHGRERINASLTQIKVKCRLTANKIPKNNNEALFSYSDLGHRENKSELNTNFHFLNVRTEVLFKFRNIVFIAQMYRHK